MDKKTSTSKPLGKLDPDALFTFRQMLKQTQDREAKGRAAMAEAVYWLDQGAPGRALELLRGTIHRLDQPAQVEQSVG